MALVGLLEDLGLTELFHMVSLFRKSGKLTLNSDRKTGVFIFKEGKLVHAADGTPRMPLGNLLMERGLVNRQALEAALEMQRKGESRRRIGAILVDMGALDSDTLEGVIREQLQEVAEEFLHRTSGFFSFKPLAEETSTTSQPEVEGLELSGGMNTDKFILEILTKLDEVGDEERIDRRAAAAGTAELMPRGDDSEQSLRALLDYMVDPAPYAELTTHDAVISEETSDLSELRSLMVEIQLRAPSFTGEITLMILRYASQVLNRGVLCRVAREGISGIGQFGLGTDSRLDMAPDRRVRDMLVPAHEPSVFFEVIENMHTYRGPLKPCHWNDYLVERLGGGPPLEVVAVPIIVDGIIIAIFYGDMLPERRPVGPLQALELLMIEAGLAIERKLLRAKLRSVEERLRQLSG